MEKNFLTNYYTNFCDRTKHFMTSQTPLYDKVPNRYVTYKIELA